MTRHGDLVTSSSIPLGIRYTTGILAEFSRGKTVYCIRPLTRVQVKAGDIVGTEVIL